MVPSIGTDYLDEVAQVALPFKRVVSRGRENNIEVWIEARAFRYISCANRETLGLVSVSMVTSKWYMQVMVCSRGLRNQPSEFQVKYLKLELEET